MYTYIFKHNIYLEKSIIGNQIKIFLWTNKNRNYNKIIIFISVGNACNNYFKNVLRITHWITHNMKTHIILLPYWNKTHLAKKIRQNALQQKYCVTVWLLLDYYVVYVYPVKHNACIARDYMLVSWTHFLDVVIIW